MRTVVAISPVEMMRMLAIAVLQRPENAGRFVASVETEDNGEGLPMARVILYDTLPEAMMADATPVSGSKAKVLQLVPKKTEVPTEAP